MIHNAAFDVAFLDHELAKLRARAQLRRQSLCRVLDTLALARAMHPGQRNNLDALCKRYGVDNSRRELHGALLDAQILADVYLAMTGGQVGLALRRARHRAHAADGAGRCGPWCDRGAAAIVVAVDEEEAAGARELMLGIIARRAAAAVCGDRSRCLPPCRERDASSSA